MDLLDSRMLNRFMNGEKVGRRPNTAKVSVYVQRKRVQKCPEM